MHTSGFHALTLVEKVREYDDVFTLRFQPSTPVNFLPGQYVHLLAPASPPGRENVRHLSIASLPSEPWLQFSLDLGSSSDYKAKLARLRVGEKAHLFKVKGEFVLGNPAPKEVVFCAGGLGITPIRALIKQIGREELPVDWRLLHVARGEFLYERELSQVGGLQARVRRPEVQSIVNDWSRSSPEALWFVSGSSRFVNGLGALLRECGVDDAQIRVEDFA